MTRTIQIKQVVGNSNMIDPMLLSILDRCAARRLLVLGWSVVPSPGKTTLITVEAQEVEGVTSVHGSAM